MFNSLHSMGAVTGAQVLDLYAGTGALGIEALSRGAASAVFVESDPRALATLRANLESTKLADQAEVMAVEVDVALAALRRSGQTFDLAVADPPYAFDGWRDLLPEIPAPLVVIESDRAVAVAEGWEIRRCKRYGGTVVTLVSAASVGPNRSGVDY